MRASRHRLGLELKHLAALAQDLEHSYRHRLNSGGRIKYVLDANVMWFMQRQLDEEDNNIKDYVAAAIGADNTASLIRTSVERLAKKTGKFTMLASHRFETEVAFASQFPQDYDALRKTLDEVIGAIVTEHRTSDPAELPKKIVEALKRNHQQNFRLLTDILSQATRKKYEIDNKTHTLVVPTLDRVPPELSNTLRKISFILRDGDNRRNFSVSQDIKALRDVALSNALGQHGRTVLLTFDKRLIQAVRLVQSWNDAWSAYLDVESCQTFWVWYLTDAELVQRAAAATLKEVMEDFRLKSRRLFLPLQSNGGGVQYLWLTNKDTLENLHEKLKNFEAPVSERDSYKVDLRQQVSEVLARLEDLDRQSEPDHADIVRKAGDDFFDEVKEMLPSFQLVVADALNPENELERLLQAHGVQKDSFLKALDVEIQAHARFSLRILGASSFVAPRTIQAVHRFSEASQARLNYRRFIHRVPLPIQSDDVDLDAVVHLVSDDERKIDAKYEELMKIASWQGAIVDLTAAYLLAGGGSWEDAEEICRANLNRTDHLLGSESAEMEMRLLLASILRIYKTNSERLKEADELLNLARVSSAPRPKSDGRDMRIKLELIAIKLNRLLIDQYGAAVFSAETQPGSNYDDSVTLVQSLIELKNEIAGIDDVMPTSLREKLNANINVNVCLVWQFIMRSKTVPVLDEDVHRQILTESFKRLAAQTSRISFFEAIIISFAILRNPDLVDSSDFHKLETAVSLREKLSRVLQRDERINDFEYWICRDILRKLNELGT